MKGLLVHTKGQASVKYALILVLVAITVTAVLAIFGCAIGDVCSQAAGALKDDSPTGPGGDHYGSLLLPYLVGLTMLLSLVFHLILKRAYVEVHKHRG